MLGQDTSLSCCLCHYNENIWFLGIWLICSFIFLKGWEGLHDKSSFSKYSILVYWANIEIENNKKSTIQCQWFRIHFKCKEAGLICNQWDKENDPTHNYSNLNSVPSNPMLTMPRNRVMMTGFPTLLSPECWFLLCLSKLLHVCLYAVNKKLIEFTFYLCTYSSAAAHMSKPAGVQHWRKAI